MTIPNPNEKGLARTVSALSPEEMYLQHLLAETRKYLDAQDMEKIERAYELANRVHKGVLRRSGEPYIQHPVEVALLLADLRIDADGIVAALLHDVVEDTDIPLEEIRELFGTTVANIVDGVTKFEAVADADPSPNDQPVANNEERLREQKQRQRAETVRKMLLAMAEDPRVVVLKLADRLHNMRTLGVMSPAQQQNKARETLEIYAPLAQRLGMYLVHAELEDLAFSYLEPERYAWLARHVEEEVRKRQPYTDRVCLLLNEEMERAGIRAEVQSWQKHLASINRKLQQGLSELGLLHDLVAFRILVNSDHDCYLALGHIHALWRPKDGRIKDFIATPKLNGYQSLHTTVFCLDNHLAEIQIRTHDMQRTADYGIASHWYLQTSGSASGGGFHKSGLSSHEMIAWIEQLRDWQRELAPRADEFVEAVKDDIFEEQIFVFTPKGEVKDLPRGSTPLDMAYRIHSDLGDHCAGARIITNMDDSGRLITRLVPLDYELKGGEIVDIMVNEEAHPTRDWLSFTRTATARTKIRRYLKTYEKEINVQMGRECLDTALKGQRIAEGVTILQEADIPIISAILGRKYVTLDDIYIAIGKEDIAEEEVSRALLPILEARGAIAPIIAEMPKEETSTKEKKQLIKLAHCCCPIPGDPIVGMLNSKNALFVHRSDCRTIQRYRTRLGGNHEHERPLLSMDWAQIEAQHYHVPISIVAHDRAGLLRDVAAVVADAGINMSAVTSSTNSSLQKAVITATLELETVDQIERIFKRLRQVKNVVSVGRKM